MHIITRQKKRYDPYTDYVCDSACDALAPRLKHFEADPCGRATGIASDAFQKRPGDSAIRLRGALMPRQGMRSATPSAMARRHDRWPRKGGCPRVATVSEADWSFWPGVHSS